MSWRKRNCHFRETTYFGSYDGELEKESLDSEFKRLMEKISDFDKSAFCKRQGDF